MSWCPFFVLHKDEMFQLLALFCHPWKSIHLVKIRDNIPGKVWEKIGFSFKDGIMLDTTQLTPEKIAQYRIQFADNDNALIALDVIEEWEGDLADDAESIATRNGIEGVEDNADFRWFVIVLNKCRDSICQPKLREKYLPALIPTLTGIIVGYLMCPPQVAGILSAIVAVYIQDQGLDKFCQNYPDS